MSMTLEHEWAMEQQRRKTPDWSHDTRSATRWLSAYRLHCETVHGATMLEDYKLDVSAWHKTHHPDCGYPR